MPEDEQIPIRSYRVCFVLERRIHKIDRWRIPVPFGVPLRGIVYAGAALLMILIVTGLPLLGSVVQLIHPALRFVVFPIGLAYALCLWDIDGRHAHLGLGGWLRFRVRSRRWVGFHPAPAVGGVEHLDSIRIAADEHAPHLPHGSVCGPATVVLRRPFDTRVRGRTIRVTPRNGECLRRGKQIVLGARDRLVVR
ncbi:MAG: hypothetical protein ACRDNK_17775 [Solirubrobacteraceae bacterium]